MSGVVGYDDTVMPDLERALLAGHDLILLGERGQAKTRIVRTLIDLLDDFAPAIEGCEINSHPERPLSAAAKSLVALHGDDTPIRWMPRDERFAEKLATPDISVGDLIGDIDPIKVAEGRHLGDEGTIHFGLVPRTNRGIIAINELPDLPERMQVALLNVLEERDVQVRGFRLRLPLDVMLVATANPDDYTNRGRIISPLKDRFGAQVRTHYPRTIDDEILIMQAESLAPPPGIEVRVPGFMDEIIARLANALRHSHEVNQRSGVSVRWSIGSREILVAGAVRRAVRTGEATAVPRVVDLGSVVTATLGRIEFDSLEEGREVEIVDRLLRQCLLAVWRNRVQGLDLQSLVDAMDEGLEIVVADDQSSSDLLGQLGGPLPGLARWMEHLEVPAEDPALAASVLEFMLEGLHLARRINKDHDALDVGNLARYSG